MKTNQLRSLAAVSLLWLAMGIGCSKEPLLPACKNGSCCWDNTTPQFIKRLDGVRADYGGSGFTFKETLVDVNGYKLDGAITCYNQWDMVDKLNLKNNFTIDSKTNKVRLVDSTRQFPYRFWGILYSIPEMPNVGPIPTLAVRVERVEEVY